MSRQTKEVRKDIYEYLKAEGFEMTPIRQSTISRLIKEHGDLHDENVKANVQRLEEHMRRCKLARKEAHAQSQGRAVPRSAAKNSA